jgi:hypothetical protein
MVNQARLHTGLHYPRSLDTALESRFYYEKFRTKFPEAIRDFDQVYAISRYGSKTSGSDFLNFIDRLGIEVQEISPSIYFHNSSVTNAFRVEEPTFDTNELRKVLYKEIANTPNITVILNSKVVGGGLGDSVQVIQLNEDRFITSEGIVIAAYAGINGIRNLFGLESFPLSFEIADVNLCLVPKKIQNTGFTVMDGPFWSLMPFGKSGFSSLTSVGLTPLEKSFGLPFFSCQTNRKDCLPSGLADCNDCAFRPISNYDHALQQMRLHFNDSIEFQQAGRLTTVKTILTNSEVDDSRPTLIQKERNEEVWTIFSGKITTIFDIEDGLL